MPPFPSHLLDPNKLSTNQLALLAGMARPAFLAVYDPVEGSFLPNSIKLPFAMYPLSLPEFAIGGAGVPSMAVNFRLVQHYLIVKPAIDGSTWPSPRKSRAVSSRSA
ncbi:hypothetical protein T492DRAFT_831604 [Pavlovales sp. CCMP2436]|nr:hypothetical protein T492DRAFT_831604 [Pavlovales sp. CCMP2436]